MKHNQFHMQIITTSFSHVQCSVQKQNIILKLIISWSLKVVLLFFYWRKVLSSLIQGIPSSFIRLKKYLLGTYYVQGNALKAVRKLKTIKVPSFKQFTKAEW